MSSSSTNTRACRGRSVSTAKRMAASLTARSGSLSLATSFARFQRQPRACNQRRTVSADTRRPRRASRLRASVAQLQRARYQPSAISSVMPANYDAAKEPGAKTNDFLRLTPSVPASRLAANKRPLRRPRNGNTTATPRSPSGNDVGPRARQ
jgi:hypothetical protein